MPLEWNVRLFPDELRRWQRDVKPTATAVMRILSLGRLTITPSHLNLERLLSCVDGWNDCPPIEVVGFNDEWFLLDGLHRCVAGLMLGQEEVLATVYFH